jgi:hypothetical protein
MMLRTSGQMLGLIGVCGPCPLPLAVRQAFVHPESPLEKRRSPVPSNPVKSLESSLNLAFHLCVCRERVKRGLEVPVVDMSDRKKRRRRFEQEKAVSEYAVRLQLGLKWSSSSP